MNRFIFFDPKLELIKHLSSKYIPLKSTAAKEFLSLSLPFHKFQQEF